MFSYCLPGEKHTCQHANVKYGIETDSVGFAMGLRNGDQILSVDNQYIENFVQITSDIVLNDRKTIQVERDGEILNIEIPTEYIPKMLKGKGQIDPRIPFGPFIVTSFGKDSPGKRAGVLIGDELVGLDSIKFTYFDEFQKYLQENKERELILNLSRNGENISIPVKPTADRFTWYKQECIH